MKLPSVKITKIFITAISFVFLLPLLVMKSHSSSANSLSNSINISASDGSQIYARTCARCHGADGRAKTAKGKQTGATDFTSSDWVPNDARDFRLVTNGKGKMPKFKGTLSEDEIKSVLAYIRKFKQ